MCIASGGLLNLMSLHRESEGLIRIYLWPCRSVFLNYEIPRSKSLSVGYLTKKDAQKTFAKVGQFYYYEEEARTHILGNLSVLLKDDKSYDKFLRSFIYFEEKEMRIIYQNKIII